MLNTATKTEQYLHSSPIELSVVIPYYRAGDIGFIPLESLIRQQNINFFWELIIIEEQFNNPFTFDKLKAYLPKLKRAGCAKVTYYALYEWIPLASKWWFLFQNIDPKSKVVCCNAADIYMSKHRLKRQYDILTSGEFNYHKISGNLVYDIEQMKHVKLMLEPDRTDTCCQALTARLAKTLPFGSRSSRVDGWRYSHFKGAGLKVFFDTSDTWQDTVNINGLNNISTTRQKRIVDIAPPFQSCCDDLSHHIPLEVASMLIACRDKVPNHRILLNRHHVN